MVLRIGFALLACWLGACAAETDTPYATVAAQLSPALENRAATDAPRLSILEPVDGATVTSPVLVRAQLDNLSLAAKGRVIDGEGHLHVLIDRPCVSPGMVIPIDEEHLHVGSGASEIAVELPVGEHRLCVQIGDGFHSAATVQDEITLFVTSSAQYEG